MNINKHIFAILLDYGVDPYLQVGERRACDMLEAAVLGVLDEIEEAQEETETEETESA